ncbi:hypothetical protein [Streptomyces sp. NPDC058623]|uniref:hypothetical protein n=1 Tax=Streptomyces sp. NPDC058623 TaxID=3346563 RepID=UPI00366702F8
MPNLTSSRLPFLALAALAISAVFGTTTHASPRAGDDVVFTYDAPDLSDDGDHVIWNWTVRNNNSHSVAHVVLTSKITPKVSVTRVSEGCEVQDSSTIRCTIPTLAAGASREGVIEADLPADLDGSVQISGRVTWQNPAAKSVTPENR